MSEVLGKTAAVTFVQFNKQVEGKVDTGATTSSLHATELSVNGNRVTFTSPSLSDNTITLDMHGAEEVHSAGNEGDKRPIIKVDIEIGGVPIQGAVFNLNDRSNMDSPLLIGQNILQAGDFTIDINKGEQEVSPGVTEAGILAALQVLIDGNVTLADLVKYLRTEAVNSIKG